MRLRRPTVPISLYREAMVELGKKGHLVMRQLEGMVFTYLEDDDETVVLTVVVDVEMVAGEPTCTRMEVTPGTQPLTRKLLGQLDPGWFARDLLVYTAMAPKGEHPGVFTPDPEGAAEVMASLPKRRSTTPARLEQVASAYRAGGITRVITACHVSKSQAYRLVDQARKAGKLPEVDE